MIKRTKLMTSSLVAAMLILPLAGCGQSATSQPANATQTTEKVEQKNNLQDSKYVAEHYLSYIYDGKTAQIEDITGEDSSEFKEEQKEFFYDRAGSVTPIEYPLIIEYDGFSEVYTPDKIKDEYATAMVNYFEQIDDYKIIDTEESEDGAELTIEVKGLAMNALANQANSYLDSLIGFDENLALSKYPSDTTQKANAVLQFWAMGELFQQGNKAPMLNDSITYTMYLEKDNQGNYQATEDTMSDVYSGSKLDSYEDGQWGHQIKNRNRGGWMEMENHRKRYKYPLKNVIQDLWDDDMGKILVYLLIFAFILLCGSVVTKINTPSDEEIRSLTQDYIEIQLGDDYKLEAWDVDINHQFGITSVEVSYIGVDSETGKKKEVMEEDISLSKIVEAIDKEKTKKRLEKEIKTAN